MLLYLLVTISGFSSLVYEIVWMRLLSLTYGNTAYATGMILALFMGGLAAGAYVFGRIHVTRSVRTYGLLEGAVGAWGICATAALGWVRSAYASISGVPVLDAIVQTLLLLVLIIPPTFMMGASLPLLLRARSDFDRRGSVGGLVYGMNTVGGLLGAFASGFVLIPLAGMRATVLVAVAGNALVCAVALMTRETRAAPERPEDHSGRRPPRVALLAYALCGASSLALEVYWTRILVLEIGSSVYAYSLVLVVLLMGVGVGSVVGGYIADRVRASSKILLAYLEVALCLSVLAQYWLLRGFGLRTGAMTAFFSIAGDFASESIALFLNVTQFFIVPTLIMGISFPLLLRGTTAQPGAEPSHAGYLYLANTIGGVAGSLAASFVFIPAFGVHVGMCIAVAANAIAALLLGDDQRRQRWLLHACVAITLLLDLLVGISPSILLESDLFRGSAERRLIDFEEDQSATVSVEEMRNNPPWLSISVNGVNVAGTAPDLLDIQAMQGHLPLLLCEHPRRVLHIGFGSGGTAYAVSTHRVMTIQVAEISPAVIRQAGRHFSGVNRRVLADRRLSIWYGDGRNYLLRTRDNFDVILSDSIHPRYSGNGSLYTTEYYRLCRAHLTPGGVVSQWLPLYTLTPENFRMILRSFVDVFPQTTVWYVHTTENPFTVVIGSNRPGAPIPLRHLVREVQEPAVAKHLAERGHADPVTILGYFIGGGPHLAQLLSSTPPHIDDRPLVEYESGRLTSRSTWADNFDFLLRAREPVFAYLDLEGVGGRDALERILTSNGKTNAEILQRQATSIRAQAAE